MLAIVAFLGLSGCGEVYRYFESGPVGWQLRRELRDEDSKTIHLAALTRFDWDEVFLFDPYTPRSAVCAALGLSEGACREKVAVESRDDGVMFIAFRRSGTLVHAEMHFRIHGDFTPVPDEQPIRKTDAVFRVVRQGRSASGEAWYRLVLDSGGASRSSPAPTP